MSVDFESKRIAGIVVEDEFEGPLLQRVAGVADAMQALRAAGFVLVLIRPDEVVVQRRKESGHRRWRRGRG